MSLVPEGFWANSTSLLWKSKQYRAKIYKPSLAHLYNSNTGGKCWTRLPSRSKILLFYSNYFELLPFQCLLPLLHQPHENIRNYLKGILCSCYKCWSWLIMFLYCIAMFLKIWYGDPTVQDPFRSVSWTSHFIWLKEYLIT